MIMSRYRYGYTVTERYQPLLIVTESNRYLRYQRSINFFNKTSNICLKGPILRSVTLVSQVTVKFGNS
jgi:hypothetical protein